MINKHSIYKYNWVFFSLLVLLLVSGTASCSDNPAMEEEDTSKKTTLSIMVRGVTQTPETDGYDEYIKTLRIIVFDDVSGMVCNEYYDQADIETWDVKGSSPDTYYEISQELQNFSGGNCRFYFIANEEGYTIYDSNNTTLTAFLENGNLMETQLKECIIASTPDTEDWSIKPILMIANPSAQYIKPGSDTKIADVNLVRCVAKMQLIVQKENTGENKIPENDVVTISNVSLHGTRPNNYSLWDNRTIINNGDEYSKLLPVENSNVGYPNEPYTSPIVYFPEKLYNDKTADGDLYFTFTLNYRPENSDATERTYTIAIGKDADDDGFVDDYNIYRNTSYTITATLKWQPTEPTMYIQVDAWGEKTMDVPAFE